MDEAVLEQRIVPAHHRRPGRRRARRGERTGRGSRSRDLRATPVSPPRPAARRRVPALPGRGGGGRRAGGVVHHTGRHRADRADPVRRDHPTPPPSDGAHSRDPPAGMRYLREIPELRAAGTEAVPGSGGVDDQTAGQAAAGEQHEPAVRCTTPTNASCAAAACAPAGNCARWACSTTARRTGSSTSTPPTTSRWPKRVAASAGHARRSAPRALSRTKRSW